MLILPTGRKVPFSRSICKMFAALNICRGMWRLVPGSCFWRHLRSHQHELQIVRTRRCFVLPVHADFFSFFFFFSHCLFPSSSLTCTAFVSSAPCRHMNHCFVAGAAKQLAPLLRQRACSTACKAASPACFCVLPAVISGTTQSFQPLRAKAVFEEVKSRSLSWKNSGSLHCFTLKAAFRVIKMQGLNRGPRDSSTF